MVNKANGVRNLFFLLFAISGFSGLIYESIWAQYLKLFLGHAAYAQSLVLAIFMGGMAIGSWLASKYSVRWKNLLLGYALAEGLIGVSGLLFHDAFIRVTEVAYNVVLPSLGSTALVHGFKWVVSALLILPQSILLGMTFPLMSAGIIRWFPKSPGASLAILYFTNSIGAAVGVLTSGFVLISLVGLPGTIMTAALINVFLAIAVWLLVKGSPAPGKLEDKQTPDAGNRRWYTVLLGVSLLTGTASFIYEIGWIRMLSLVLGSSTHAFELMLSAFIFGLALGGLWIRRRIDRIDNIIRFIALVQLVMGFLALLTLPVYGHTFEFMQWTLAVLSKTDAAYTVFNLSSHLIGLAVMLPATFCAGMTLPLITCALIQQKHGEKSIGAVYAANTVGAIVGVVFAVHIGMTVFGLKGLICLGAGVDIVLGLFLLWRLRQSEGTRKPMITTAIGIAGVVAALLWVDLDAYKMASGVYRSGHMLSPNSVEILYHEDGKTATIDVVAEEHAIQVRTNGKTEAKIALSKNFPPATDEPTTILAGAIPLAIHPAAKKVANIGMGSGLTTHTLLGAPWLETVDTIEIEPAMIEAAQRFGSRVEAIFTDPRSHIYIEDAKTYFSTQNKKYDIIVSEPSNPWVSGIASLFSEEFYRLITRHLNKDGVLVQWLQLYEIDLKLVASVFKSLSRHFSDYAVYGTTNSDVIVVARHNTKITRPDARIFRTSGLKEALERIGVRGISDIELRNIGGRDVLEPLFASFSIPHNSDYFPVLDLNAVKSRFLGAHALDLIGLGHVGVPAVEMLGVTVDKFRATDVTASPLFYRAQTARNAVAVRDFFMTGHFNYTGNHVAVDTKRDAELVRSFLRDCEYARRWDIWLDSLINVAAEMIPYLIPQEVEQVWTKLGLSKCDNKLNATQKHWISLLKAVSQRDADGMAETAAVLLSDAEPDRRGNFDYALAAGMLGNIARETPEEAQRLWNTYGARLDGSREPRLLFRLLLAHSQESPAYVRWAINE